MMGKTSKIVFVVILTLVTLAFLTILRPYFSSVLWAIILAVIFYKMKIWLTRATNGRNGLASFLTLLAICLIVFTPLAIIASSLAREFNIVYQSLQSDNATLSKLFYEYFGYLPGWARSLLTEYDLDNLADIRSKLSEVAMKGSQYAAGSVLLISKNTFSLAVGFGVMLYLLFFFLKDGARLVELAFKAIPLENNMKYRLFARFAAVARATVKGTVVVAVVQGALGGIAFYFAGIEASLLWGALMAFLSLIPAVGTALIWIPAAIYLFASGAIITGILLTLWFVVVVGLSDNILRPLLVGKDIRMPDWLILITTLGGLSIYGINGFVIGPMVAALFVTCWNYFYQADQEKRRVSGEDSKVPAQQDAAEPKS
ncbi:MAG TPA: AI-2E family transporter [Atlantibacter hermannii]|nr:AI-2E family transporter [Atlantibacter hermannii]